MEGRNKDVVDLRRKKMNFVSVLCICTRIIYQGIHVCEFSLQQYDLIESFNP